MSYTLHAFSLFRMGVLRPFKLVLQSARGQKKSVKNQTEMVGSSGKLFMGDGSKGIEAKAKQSRRMDI